MGGQEEEEESDQPGRLLAEGLPKLFGAAGAVVGRTGV